MAGTQPTESWRDWLRLNGGRLLLFARQQTRCEADAQDVVQEAMMRLWTRKTRRIDREPPAMPIAFAAIRRCAIDLARREASRHAREHRYDQEHRESEEWFRSDAESEERTRSVVEAMRKLPATHQEVLVLKIWGELTFAEIAGILGIPLNTAASRYRYGLEGLRKQLHATAL